MPRFELDFNTTELHLKQVFTISRGSKPTVNNVFVQLRAQGISGYGEAAPNSRYQEDAGRAEAWLKALPSNFFDNIETPDQLAKKIKHRSKHRPSVKSAQAATEMAWLDWWGKQRGRPVWQLWKASSSTGPVTSFTIGLDTLEVMKQKVREATEFPVLKVKLGTDRDQQIITAIRQVTDKPLRVDANEGWTSLDKAKAAIDFLADKNIEMVEQPMPASRLQDMVRLKNYSPIPLCADESFEGEEDLEAITTAFDIINIKLMKTGSLVSAKSVIQEAKKQGLKVMIGCMIESSLANSAGALLSLWADFADLDGHLLIADDPYKGLHLDKNKRVSLSNKPGLGVTKR